MLVRLNVRADNNINTLVLKDVAFAPRLAVNVVSTAKLEITGYKIITFQGKSTILLDDELVKEAS